MSVLKPKLISIFLGTVVGVTLALSATLLIAKEDETDQSRIPLEDVQRFSTAVSQIKNYYVKPIEDNELFANAIRGMLEGLDPHSSYLDEKDFKDLQSATKGEFGGLGIEVTMENGLIKVITPLDDTPAFKAGVKAGDLIIRLDKTPVKGLTLRDAVGKMRGKKGTPIKITVIRQGETKPLVFDITRDKIQIQSVKSRILEDGYGYVRVSHFQAMTSKDLLKAVAELKKDNGGKLKGLVLDLRNNPGGLLDAAIQISDAFIHNDQKGDDEMIVFTKGRIPGAKFTALATPGDVLESAPMVVLINAGSASGSEIVAGALKDNHRALLLGTKSFGKGSVQTILPLDNERGIKLTTALYYTPSGKSIQATGIEPDIIIEDLKIPELAADKDKVAGLTEADLSGHLDNGNSEKEAAKKSSGKNSQDKTAAKEDTPKKKLLHTDYQLHAALNILKGMALQDK